MLSSDEVARLLAGLPHELRNVELKGPGPLSAPNLLAKVVRAMLGMANLRDGGVILVGVLDDRTPVGLSPGDLATWEYDDLASKVARYADPMVEFELTKVSVNSDQVLVAIEVKQFRTEPILCKKDLNVGADLVLRNGACYVRPVGRVETADVPNSQSMRELLDLATDSRLRDFVARASRVGIDLPSVAPQNDAVIYQSQLVTTPDDSVSYEEIVSRGYWQVVLRPVQFKAQRIADIGDLRRIVEAAQVRLRGWYFPYVDREAEKRGADSVWQDVEFSEKREHWRAWQSGQFADINAFDLDWRHLVDGKTARNGKPLTELFDVIELVFTLTEIFEFAANYTRSLPDGGDEYWLSVRLHGLKGRQLFVSSRERAGLYGPYEANVDELAAFEEATSSIELTASHRKMAVGAALSVVKRFGWDANLAVLESVQNDLTTGR